MKNHAFRNTIFAITYAVLLLFLFLNFRTAWGIITNFFAILTPLFYGLVIAYILNFPFRFFKDKAFKKIGAKHKKLAVIKMPLALVCAYIIGISVITFLLLIIIPQLIQNIEAFINNFSTHTENFQQVQADFISWLNSSFGLELDSKTIIDEILNQLTKWFQQKDIPTMLQSWASVAVPFVADAAKNVTVNVYNWIIAIILSVYLLASKEKLLRQCGKFANAYVPKRARPKLFEIAHLSNDMCGKFLVGRILDAMSIGVLTFIGMSIFGFDYPLLISVIVGVTNIIPFFGPLIGAIPSAFLLLLIDPVQCFWFIIFIVILQQIDGNIIEPKIVGGSVGVSGFWVIVSVIIGGGLFGVPGMVLGVPVFAVIYTLLSQNVRKREMESLLLDNKKESARETGEAVTDTGENTEEANSPSLKKNEEENQ